LVFCEYNVLPFKKKIPGLNQHVLMYARAYTLTQTFFCLKLLFLQILYKFQCIRCVWNMLNKHTSHKCYVYCSFIVTRHHTPYFYMQQICRKKKKKKNEQKNKKIKILIFVQPKKTRFSQTHI
jgi:hypothetical protein